MTYTFQAPSDCIPADRRMAPWNSERPSGLLSPAVQPKSPQIASQCLLCCYLMLLTLLHCELAAPDCCWILDLLLL